MSNYPNCDKLNIPILTQNGKTYFVKRKDLDAGLKKANLDAEKFSKLFGSQTCPVIDSKPCLYPWDVEAVLERMISGKLTGSQKDWD